MCLLPLVVDAVRTASTPADVFRCGMGWWFLEGVRFMKASQGSQINTGRFLVWRDPFYGVCVCLTRFLCLLE